MVGCVGLNFRVDGGSRHLCVTTNDMEVKCFGFNCCGQLGSGSTVGMLGGSEDTIGDNLMAVDLPDSCIPYYVVAGANHNCVMCNSDKLACFGYNAVGQLGIESIDTKGDEAGEMGNALPF